MDRILAEETTVLDLVGARDDRRSPGSPTTTPQGCRRIRPARSPTIAASPWLVQPLSAPAGAGKTTSMRALRDGRRTAAGARVVVVAPTGKAVDVALREGAGDAGDTIAKALQSP